MKIKTKDIKDRIETRFGWIPNNWVSLKFKEILVEGRLGGNYENSESNTGLPVIKMGNLDRGIMKTEKLQYLPGGLNYNDNDILKKGDLLFNTRNTLDLVGKVAIWNSELPKAVYNSNLMRLKFNASYVESNWFMNYVFNSHYGLRQLRGIATGTTSVAAIYGRDLNTIKFLLPPLSEQRKIAEILRTWDEAIQITQTSIVELKKRHKGLAQELLSGKKRLPGFSGEWDELKVGDVTEKFAKRNKDLIDASVFSVTNTSGFVLQSDHFSREVAGDDLSSYKIISNGEFAYNPARINVGSIAYFENEIGIISSLYVCFKTKEQVLDEFINYWLKLEKTVFDFGRFGEGGVRIYLWYDLFAKIKIRIPPVSEQIAIVSILKEASAEIELLEQKLESLQLQKKGLMQKLLTGEIRVKI